MKPLILASLLWLSPALALAADAAPATKPAAKPAVKAPAKTQAKAPVKKAAPARKSAAGANAKQAAVAAAPEPVPEVVVLSAEEKAVSERVYTGAIKCELGATVQVDADVRSPGTFLVSGKGFKYHMRPMVSSAGAVRLEDQHSGAVWIQIANKSMLMNQKLGQRMADECMSAQQQAVTQAMKGAPAPSLFDSAPMGSR